MIAPSRMSTVTATVIWRCQSTMSMTSMRLPRRTASILPTDVRNFIATVRLMAKFFFLQDPDGYKIEVLQRHGRYT